MTQQPELRGMRYTVQRKKQEKQRKFYRAPVQNQEPLFPKTYPPEYVEMRQKLHGKELPCDTPTSSGNSAKDDLSP